jgi:hypothetical protein
MALAGQVAISSGWSLLRYFRRRPRRAKVSPLRAAIPPAKPRIAISLGDPSGIGPEVTAAALADRDVLRALTPIVFGDGRLFARACGAMGVRDRLARVETAGEADAPSLVEVSALAQRDSRPGKPTPEGGRAQLPTSIEPCRRSRRATPTRSAPRLFLRWPGRSAEI